MKDEWTGGQPVGVAEQERLEDEIQQLREQLSAAQSLLRSMPRSFGINENDIGDTGSLDAAIAAAQKPLVDALKKMVAVYGRGYEQGATVIEAKAALAKAKDGKCLDEPAIKVSGDYCVTISNGDIKK